MKKYIAAISILAINLSLLADNLSIRIVSYSDVGASRHITLGVTNTSTNFLYGVYRRTTVIGSETLISTNFIGNNGEAQITDVVPVSDPSYFYRAKQEQGFIVWRTPGAAAKTK